MVAPIVTIIMKSESRATTKSYQRVSWAMWACQPTPLVMIHQPVYVSSLLFALLNKSVHTKQLVQNSTHMKG